MLPRATEVASAQERGYVDRRFDLQTDLPSGAADLLLAEYQRQRGRQGLRDAAIKLAANFLVMFPERRSELDLDEELWQAYKTDLIHDKGVQQWDFLVGAVNCAVLFPERISELEMDDDLFESLVMNSMETRRESNWFGFSKAAAAIYVYYPERRSDLNVGEPEFQEILAEIQLKFKFRQFGTAAAIARNLTILFPGRNNEVREALPGVEELIEYINKYWSDNSKSASAAAANLTFLAADRVVVSKTGIELITQGELVDAPELPKRNLV